MGYTVMPFLQLSQSIKYESRSKMFNRLSLIVIKESG